MTKINKYLYSNNLSISYLSYDDFKSDLNIYLPSEIKDQDIYLSFLSCVSLISFDLKSILDEITFKIISTGRIKELSCIGNYEVNIIPRFEINKKEKKNIIEGSFLVETWQNKMNRYNSYVDIKNDNIFKLFNNYFKESVQKKAFFFLYSDQKYNKKYIFKIEHIPNKSQKDYQKLKSLATKKEKKEEVNEFYNIILSNKDNSLLTKIDEKAINLKCTCSKNKFVSILKNFSKKEQEELFLKDKVVEVNCQKCGQKFLIKKEEVLGG